MHKDQIYKLYSEIEQKRGVGCQLCKLGVPGGDSILSRPHHITKRSELPGDENESLLWNKVNIALPCQKHHERFGNPPFRALWALANIKQGYADYEDYKAYPIEADEWEIGNILLGECMGEFGLGTEFFADFRGTPLMAIIQATHWGREDARLDDYCELLCPFAQDCLKTKREILVIQIGLENVKCEVTPLG